MASPADLAVHEPTKIVRRKRSSGKQVKLEELEREVLMLRKMLDDEQKVHEILEGVHHQRDHSSLYPSFLPPKAKELLAELAMVEDEIARLERQIGQLQTDLDREKQVTKDRDVSQKLQPPTLNNKPQYGFSLPSPNLTNFIKGDSERMPFETKALHFISKAIKGDYNLRDFTANDQKLRNLSGFSDRQENNFHDHHEAGLPQEKIPRKNGVLLKPSSPLRETRHLTPRRDRILEIPLDLPPKSAANPIQSEEENIQKWPPNKLAENIMKCLIFIFVRLLRTSRAMELEKSGAISRSANFSSSSRSFRVDTNSSNSKASFMLQRESRQQDPYGVFSTKESIPRDIGPYKNLVVFTSRNLDPKCISNSNSAPLVQRLRVLVNSLQKVELRLLTYQQKLAFWINVYNACIMHGFIQYGVPSSPEKLLTLMNKATLNVGGNTINAHTIEHYILRKPASSILKEVSRKVDVEDKEVTVRRLYGLESPDPNVTFSLCCGTRSSPAVRIYTAEGVVGELEKSKLEYLQASIVVTSGKRMALPELLLRNMYDFAPDMDSLVEWVCHQLPTSGSLRKSIVECFRSLNSVSGTTTTSGSAKISSVVDKIPYDFEFQYLLSI